jgi:dTDP-4-dehydrorhamnose reductase
MLSTIAILGTGSTTAGALIPMLLQETGAFLHLITGSDVELAHDRVQVSQLDVTDRAALKEAMLARMPQVVINLAALTNVDECESDKKLAWKLNVTLVENLVRICRAADAHLVHLSTDYVFDGEKGPYTEADVPSPLNYYGKSKLAGENAITTSGIEATIVRTNVLYGPNPSRPDFVHWVLSCSERGLGIRAASDQFGNPTYVDDVAEAIVRLIDRKLTGLFHVGGAEYISRFEFAKRVARTFKLDESAVEPVHSADLAQVARRPLRAGLVSLKAETELRMRFRGVDSGLVSLRHALFSKK